MRVVVTGATGNIGTKVVQALAGDAEIDAVVGVARRPTSWRPDPKVRFESIDVGTDDLDDAFAGADAVVHLAWEIQPSHDAARQARTNVVGTMRVLAAAEAVGAGTLVHASSIGTYSPGPKGALVPETWPTGGIGSLPYSVQKAAVEALLDEAEARATPVRIVRLRPALVLTPRAATGIRRLFLGALDPTAIAPPSALFAAIDNGPARFQVVDGGDVAEAVRQAVHRTRARGAYNLATDDVIGRDGGALLGALRPIAWTMWLGLLLPADPGWIDLVRQLPLVSSERAGDELGWRPRRSGHEVLRRFLDGLRDGRDFPTPPLGDDPVAGDGQLRVPAGQT